MTSRTIVRASLGARRLVAAVALGLITLSGCATMRELAALRSVDFQFDRITEVRIAGVRLSESTRFSDLAPLDVARLVAATTANEVPLEMVVHVRARNPEENQVSARLVAMDWRLFIEQRQIVEGALAGSHLMPPGEPVDLPVAVRLDLAEHFRGGARDVIETALAIAGYGGRARELRLELEPTVQTGIGPIRYPSPIVVRRPAD